MKIYNNLLNGNFYISTNRLPDNGFFPCHYTIYYTIVINKCLEVSFNVVIFGNVYKFALHAFFVVIESQAFSYTLSELRYRAEFMKNKSLAHKTKI